MVEKMKLGYCGPCQRQTSGTNQQSKTVRQGHYWVGDLTHCPAIKEETIA